MIAVTDIGKRERPNHSHSGPWQAESSHRTDLYRASGTKMPKPLRWGTILRLQARVAWSRNSWRSVSANCEKLILIQWFEQNLGWQTRDQVGSGRRTKARINGLPVYKSCAHHESEVYHMQFNFLELISNSIISAISASERNSAQNFLKLKCRTC